MDSYIYDLVKDNQKPLTSEEQYELAFEIRRSCDRILEICYLHPKCREIILDTLERTINLSKLGRDYNSAILGHNKSIHDRIEIVKNSLPKMGFLEGGKALVKANLHPRLVLNPDILFALKSGVSWQTTRVLAELDALEHNRMLLVYCVLNAAAEVAMQKHKQLNNDVIQVADLFQCAALTAYEGTLLYNYDSKAKWSSFVYSRMHDSVGNYIADKSRTVAVPRSTIERFNVVVRAMAATQSIEPTTIMGYANELVKNEKALAYTEEEIETILKSMQGNISLDFVIDEDAENGKHTLIDVLAFDSEAESDITRAFLKRNVTDSVAKLLSPLEHSVVDLLWGLTTGEPKDLNATYEEIKLRFPEKKISKARIKRTADKVLKKLRQNPELRTIWREL